MKKLIKGIMEKNTNKYMQVFLREVWGLLFRTKRIIKGRKKFNNDKRKYSELNTRKIFNINKKYLLPMVMDWGGRVCRDYRNIFLPRPMVCK